MELYWKNVTSSNFFFVQWRSGETVLFRTKIPLLRICANDDGGRASNDDGLIYGVYTNMYAKNFLFWSGPSVEALNSEESIQT